MLQTTDNLQVDDNMLCYITPLENLHRQQGKRNHPLLLLNDCDEIVTYFGLQEEHEYHEYYPNQQTCLMRSYSTDLRHLRKGYGKASLALLPDFMHEKYPDLQLIDQSNERTFTSATITNHSKYVILFYSKRHIFQCMNGFFFLMKCLVNIAKLNQR